ncbi:DUF2065 domain-containing protein [Pseudotabrizicola sediminis]|uniref:DUF2065 domain-containing protein n=1 Tax=Pseudotabrizicola sediminis TaxID=2486418 RepID=A0ABY2KJT9_9RHOB|nr:DUF2065 domain-containing protein [Pseudotabrizicola sediminis]TGD42690.1 DUF2065 domain-containing protein [Pseudotabrizicola sediminis]TGD63612.1 DUF2065 domain-containing protein [Tabrizicola sp. WMC-M-20]
MIWVLLAIGLVAVVEGLVLALAPSRLEQVLAMMASLSIDNRRLVGLVSVAVGATLIALARWIGF